MAKKTATSIKIDPEVWKEAKIEAIRRDMQVSELVEEAIRKWIKSSSEAEEYDKQRKHRGS